MPFRIVRNDITNMAVDAIVNSANPRPLVGGGTDMRIHEKAGPQLLEARKQIGNIRVGEAAITPGYQLSADYVIHTVGPVWRGGFLGETKKLRQCYVSSLRLAREKGCRSIAFPLISSGTYGYPKDLALRCAVQVFRAFLKDHEMDIFLVVFDRESFRLSEELTRNVASYIDEHYVEVTRKLEYRAYQTEAQDRSALPEPCPPSTLYQSREPQFRETCPAPRPSRSRPGRELGDTARKPSAPMAAPRSAAPTAAAPSLDEMLANTDAGFAETLLKLIDQTGEKDSVIYKKANVTKQHFSKIRNNPDYKPSKATAVAFAIALELDLAQTKDLIGRAGFALSNSSKFDVIITYFIRERRYDMYEINATLFQFDQMLLGV